MDRSARKSGMSVGIEVLAAGARKLANLQEAWTRVVLFHASITRPFRWQGAGRAAHQRGRGGHRPRHLDRFAAGEGARSIADALNPAGIPSPRAQQVRPSGWSDSPHCCPLRTDSK